MERTTTDLIEENIHDKMACNGKECWICEIIDLLATIALMFRTKEQGNHSCYNWLFPCNIFMSFSFDSLLLLFVFKALFLVFLCLIHVARSKLSHVLLFSSLYFCCIVLVISSFHLVVKPVFHVSLTSFLMFRCFLLVMKLISYYFVSCRLHLWYSCVFFFSSIW
jgi:hypothetical protein